MWQSLKNNYTSDPSLYKYDLDSSSWSIVMISGPSIEFLQLHGQCVYKESLYIIYGYQTYKDEFYSTLHRVDLESNNKVWEVIKIPSANTGSASFGLLCSRETIFLFGGASKKGPSNQLLKISLSASSVDIVELSKSMNVPKARYGHAMEVYDDKLYILGGMDISGNDLIDISTFDLETERWNSITYKSSYAPSPRSELAHTRMGEILIIFGGSSNSNLLGDMNYFNLRTREWKAVEPKSTDNPTTRKGSCMASADNNIFIFGGITNEGYSDELWMFDSGTSTYTLLKSLGDTPMNTARGSCRAYTEGKNEIIFETYLGESNSRMPLSTIYQYKLSTNTWTTIKPQQQDYIRGSLGVALYLEDKLLVAGGAYWQFFVTNELYIYDSKTKALKKLDQTLPHSVYNAASVYYKNKLYIHGGGASYQKLPLPDIPMNNLIVIDLDDNCTDSPELCKSSCSPGTYYDNGSCKSCPMGSYKDSIGFMTCSKCLPGFYSDTEGADSSRFCKPCSQGTYNLQEGENMCYECLRGNECSLNKIKSEQEAANINSMSDQPDIYKTNEDKVEEISYIFDLILATVSSVTITFLFLFIRTRKILIRLDLFTFQHNFDLNTPLVSKKTFIGGVASSIFFVIAISILVKMSLAFGLDNITETKALVPLVALEQEYGSVISI
jgi:N-acetylneuraminic acid mutarotase